MKVKKLIPVILAMVLTLTLTACGASSGSKQDSAESNDMAVMETVTAVAPGTAAGEMKEESNSAQNGDSDRKLIRRVYMDVETEDLDNTIAALTSRVNAAGGYFESQEQYNGSNYSSYRSRSASLVIRIPAENLDDFLGQVESISNVTSFRQSQEDVTLDYVATESRVKALETEEERLLELMKQAETMSDLLDIEDRLTDVRYELERMTSQLRVMSNQVSYATVNLEIQQVRVYTPVEKQTVWQRISTGFTENLGDVWESLQDFFVWFVVYLPQILIFLVIVLVIVGLCRRSAKKRRKRMLEQQQNYLKAQQNLQQNREQEPPKA